MHLEKYYSNKYIFWILLLLLMLMLPQWVVAQSSLPACTASIADTDGDSITDDDGTGGRIDIDKDGDGLIEICDLEGINEIRYQLDGSGYKPRPDATKMTHGCPHSGCIGYELVSSLDFNVDASYRSVSANKDAWTNPNAAGWQPIGSTVAPFSSVFEGNEHTISGLYINRTAMNIALFAVMHGDGELRNIGLSDVDIQGSAVVGSLVASNHGRIIHSDVGGTVNGDTTVGGLVGSNDGQIIFSIADVAVTGLINQVGGLAGSNVSLIRESSASGNVAGIDYVGGLVGLNEGDIINSYASGEVRGSNRIGGLTGAIATGARIINTYAEGTVSGADQVGGLVGEHSGEMSNSYAVVEVTSNGSDIGGLVGTSATVAVITASYWDKTVNASLSESANARTTAELQMPTAAGGTAMAIYYRWSEIAWYFGGDTDYPRLRYAVAIDGDGDRVNDAADIDDDNDGLIEIYYLDDLHTMRFQPDGSGHRQSAIESKNTTGCPRGGCIGYELTRALDFNNANDYRNYLINTDWIVADYADTSASGWQPIANFEAVFNGNGHIISNLQINRVSEQHVGLFAVLGADGRIENVELLYPNIRGHSDVGSLVGINRGVVINSFVRDYDTDANNRDTTQYIEALEGSVGGLVGRNDGGNNNKGAISNSGAVVTVQIKDSATAKEATAGGLVGFSAGDIRNSYARGEAKGPCMVGGLTAQLEENSKVVNSYASVTVTTGFGACTTAANIQSGSLVATNNGLVEDSYATGCWSAATSGGTVNNRRGGLIFTNSGRINNSYYQNCGGLLEVSSGSAKTQMELQSPTTATAVSGIYQAWSNSDWDFGSNSQYPAIRYSVGADKDNPGCGYRGLPDCGVLIKNQLPTGRVVTDSVSAVANLNFVPGNILTAISRQEDIGAFTLQPPRFDFADNTYKLYVQDVRTDPTDTSDTMQFNLMLGSDYQFSNCNTNITTLSSGMGSLSCVNSGAEVLFNLPHTITFNITDTSTSPPTAYGLFSIEIIPIPIPNIFTPNNILEEINAVENIGSFVLEPPAFDTNITNYQLHVQDARTSVDQQMHLRLMLSSPYDFGNFEGHTCRTNINRLPGGQGGVSCPEKLVQVGNDILDDVYRELNSEFNREHTVSFKLILRETNELPEQNIQIIPGYIPQPLSIIVNSRVNGAPTTFVGDGEILIVNEGDTVSVDAMDSFVSREDVNQPLDYYWYSRSDPTLFSGVRRGAATSFTINNTIFGDSRSDAILVLEVRDKYNPTATPIIKEIPIRLFGRLSLSSDVGEVMRDRVTSTLHRIVLPHDQPQAVITARSLHDNITLTVDDSDTQVTAVNGTGTFTASMITVQVDEGGKTEFTIAETVAGDVIVLHQVQVFRRSAAVVLAGVQLENVTVDASISVPGTYSAILAEGMSNVTLTEFSLTVTDTNASAVTTMTVDADGSGGNPAQSVIEPTIYYDPGVVANIATKSFDLMVGSVIEITLRMRDEYVVATRASPTLEDLPYREGVYTIEIVSRPVTIIDDDINGLIDIDTLEDLDDIRNHYANMPRSCGIEAIQQCRGFELRRSLDFNVDASYSSLANKMSWTMGDGWQPIGLGASGFNSRFEGNGHTISGLHMNRSGNDIGLFSILDATGEIKNVGLLDVEVEGDSHIGGLVGRNHGTIINSYVSTATVVGNMDVGGLVGRNDGSIISSFAVVKVSGNGRIGGLVGNHQGRITNAYAAGTVSGSHATLDLPLGGLVGRNGGSITNSYAISLVQPQITNAVQSGGLIGMMSSTATIATITASYWNRTVNASLMRSANARTTAELQNPTMAGTNPADTYYGWHSNDWDFGDNVDYPVLRYATDAGINACNTTTTSVMTRCGSLLPNQNIRLLSSAFGVSHIMISSQPAANSDSTINEGSVVRLMVDVFDDKEYSYQWSQTSGNPLTLVNTTSATVQVTIPTDFIATDATVADITLEVTVDDGVATIRQSEMITINKTNNGNPDFTTDVSAARSHVIAQPDADGAGVFSYQWQQLEFGREWANITDATTATYWLPADSNNTIRYRVNIKHTDGQGYTTNYQQGPFRMGVIDDDSDGLIDIYYLEDIDAMRYQLDGSGYKMSMQATANTHGCPGQMCSGYELRRDLDFNADASYSSTANQVAWTTGAGWQPIGSDANPFNSVFEGNGHIIANLQISRAADDLGLYAVVGADGKIINVQLLDVDVEGRNRVSALVGQNYGAIINSYVTGEVSGLNDTGGLSSRNRSSGTIINSYAVVAVTGRIFDTGGLVSVNSGLITSSYAVGNVKGRTRSGALVGRNFGAIINSYATGTVTGGSRTGGLVGDNRGSITNSYATGAVTGGSRTGGLVGANIGGVVTASYWNTSTTNVMTSADGIPKTTVELQSPTDATGIYSDWSRNDWEFGGSEDYPVLRYARDDNLVSCASDAADIVISPALPICGSVLPEQGTRAISKGLAGVFFFAGGHATPIELTPSFSQLIYSYDMTVVTADRNIQLRPYAVNANAEIAITGGSTDYFSNRASGALSDAIDLKANETTVTIVVTDIVGEDLSHTTYTFVIVRLLPIRVDTSLSRLTLIFEEATADPDGAGSFSYQWQQQKPGSRWRNIVAATTPTYWLPAGADGSILYRIINIKHTDGRGSITDYPQQGPFRASIDDDGDGLIDIYTLDDLDAIRYQLDGRSYRNESTKLIMQNCPQQACNGYELRKDLDFNADTDYRTTSSKVIWTTGSGWVPIGDDNNRFSSVLEGNGHTISGLYIDNKGLLIGLFSVLDTNSEIKNVGLLNIDITSYNNSEGNAGTVAVENYGSIINSYASGDIVGNYRIAGLVSWNRSEGKIMSSFANVNVVADSESAGGLVEHNDGLIINSYATGTVRSNNVGGGLVSSNYGSIISSYATGDIIKSGNLVGGLVGANYGSIKNTYARGAVSGVDRVGGLVGFNGIGSSIAYSYATGTVAGNRGVGGLIGSNNGDITTSYWDTDTSDINSSADGSSQTTVELQSPTGASATETEVYHGWSESDWDFGSSNRYPALRYVSGDGLNACRASDAILSLLPACGTLLSQQRRGLDRMLLMANDEDVTELLTPSFSHSIFSYKTTLTTIATPISFTLKPLATHANATIKITQQGDTTTDYFAGKANDTLSNPIISTHPITLEVVVTDTLYGDITTDTIYTVEIEIPITVAEFTTSLDAAHADGTIDEGSTATITFAVSGGSGNYRYQYKLIDGASERELSQLPPPVGLSMPADLVAAENTTQTVELNILVSDDEGRRFEQSAEIMVRKVDNGLAMVDVIRATSRTLTVKIGSDPDGDASEPGYEYQWQWREPEAGSSWQDIMLATTASYRISGDLAVVGNEFRVQVIYTDGQGYRPDGGVYSDVVQYILLPMCVNEITDSDGDDVVGSIDIDKDGDGLIELCDLEGINEMRYQLDGSGYKVSESAIAIRQGCPIVAGEAQCRGYELVRDLDFNDAKSYRNNTTSSEWTAGAGWLPITANFGSVFGGNGYSISGLYINQTEPASGSEQGLFSTLAATAQINNIRLLDVNVQGVSVVAALASRNAGAISDSSVTGAVVADADVGGLVGINDGQIISSFADVAVTGSDNIGGLVGSHHGSITNSYATGDVEGMNNIGGLVGLNSELGRITNTYAEGTVMGASQVGGLVGRHHGSIMNSYATIGAVIGNESSSNIGGLIGMMSSTATIIASYWNSETSEQESSAGGRAQMTAELQNPIAPGTTTTDVYYRWSSNDWDFGNSSHYPALRYAADDDLNDCVTNITTSSLVLPCNLLLPNQRGRNKGLATVFFFADGEQTAMTSVPPFTPLTASYDMTILIPQGSISQIQLRPYAINDNAAIVVTQQGATTDYFTNKPSGALSDTISLAAETTLMIIVSDNLDGDSVHTTYTFTIARTRPPLVISGPMITPLATIDEGSHTTITYTVSGGSGVYEYAYKIDDGAFTQSSPSFMYRAPVDLVATDADMQTVRITIRVNDQDEDVEVLEHSEEITVRKINNGNDFSIRPEVDGLQLHILSEGSDPDGDGSFSYQWQQRGLDGIWKDIEGTTTASYVLSDSNGSVRYRVTVKHTDGQGYEKNYPTQGPFRVGLIDDDRDSLIDIYYLDDLNAIRYQLDGKGYKMSLSATTNTAGCPLTGCIGYELRRDLDFTADASYGVIANKAMWAADSAIKANATNSGWLPIGDTNNRFSGVFEGNGFVISNLYTKAGNDKGLFSVLDNSGEIKRVGLLDAYVEGDTQIGTLVGNNYGKITNSYATASTAIASGSESSPVGGLVGFNQTGGQIISSFANVVVMASSHIAGGLVGRNNGLIINSYATGNVSGMNEIGGLVGRQDSGSVMNSYATGDINGQLDIGGLIGYASGDITNTYAGGAVTGERVGGLTGWNISNITNSYALGRVSGSRIAGGLFGLGSGRITASYWDRTVNSNLTMTANAKTTAELQTPTAPGLMATDVYYGWSSSDWDFGDNHHYPALRHARGPANLNACNTDITLPSEVLPSAVLPCSVPLPNQRGRDKGLATVFVLADGVDLTKGLRPLFSPLRFSYDMAIVSTATHVEFSLRPYAINDNATITITDPTDENYFSGKLNGGLSATIALADAITLTVVVTDTIDEATINTTYTFVINRVLPLVVSGIMVSSDTIDEGAIATLSFEVSGGTDVYRYAYKLITGEDEALLAQSAPPVELTIPTDIVAAEDEQQAVTLQIIVSDDGGQTVETSKTLTIRKLDNGKAEITIRRETSRKLIVVVGSDPDGNAADPNYTYQWQSRIAETNSEWVNIMSATSASYTITDDLAMADHEFRVQVTYDDGQGYRATLESNALATVLPLEVSAVMISSQPAANADGTINEGSDATITFEVSGGSSRYTYDYTIGEQSLPSSSVPSLIYNVPTDLIKVESTHQTVELHITVNDVEGQTLEHTEDLMIKKVNNGSADIAITEENNILAVTVGSDPDGDPNPAGYTYQWQLRALAPSSPWMDIEFATNNTYTIVDDLAMAGREFRVQVTYDDGQGYRAMLESNVLAIVPPLEVSAVMISSQPAANADGTINEGSTATVTFEVSGGSRSYTYDYTIGEQPLPSSSTPSLMYNVPTDLIKAESTRQTVELHITVNDTTGQTLEHTANLMIKKVDNGEAEIAISRETTRTLMVKVGSDPDGDPNPAGHTYQWQTRALEPSSRWMNINSATNDTYTITDDLANAGGEFRIQVMYTDGQGYKETLISNVIQHTSPSQGIKVRTKVFLEGPLR